MVNDTWRHHSQGHHQAQVLSIGLIPTYSKLVDYG